MILWETQSSLDHWSNFAIDEVKEAYGHTIILKPKSLLKFGRSETLGTSYETVWQRGGDETYQTANTIDSISSDDAGDVGSVVVEGHTIDGVTGDLSFVRQLVTLQGQTKTGLPIPMARANRVFNDGATDFAGTVYVYQDDTVSGGVPSTTAKIHLQSSGANNQSLKAATSISKDDYWLIKSMYAAVNKKTAAVADFDLQVREKGKVFRTRVQLAASSTGGLSFVEFEPYLIVPANSDVRVHASASASGVAVVSWMNGPLARIIG